MYFYLMQIRIFENLKHFVHEVTRLVQSLVFILLTVLGNGLIGTASLFFYNIEKGVNPKVTHIVDALWFCFSTATTTGYGDIIPVTHGGKLISIILMLVGTALFALYTGLFADAILSSERFKK